MKHQTPLRKKPKSISLFLPFVLWLLCWMAPSILTGGQVIQHFPADQPESSSQTRWRIVWGIRNHGGGSEVLYIKEAYFKRSRTENEIQVLGNATLAEIFVPYHGGTRIYDLSGYQFTLADLTPNALGPACIRPGQIYDRQNNPGGSGPVAVEMHDDDLRWMDVQNRTRRGQVLILWAALEAGNYRYIMQYRFRDDGVVGFRLGATASNLFDSDEDSTTHLHSGWWRVEPVLGDANRLTVSKVHIETSPQPRTVITPLNAEDRVAWQAEQFTKLRIQSETKRNGHVPPHFISFEVTPHVGGTGRYQETGEEFTQHELWVTRARSGEVRPKDLPTYTNQESIKRKNLAIWHQSAALHAPRDEDFGAEGANSYEGLAITAWAGFDLKPRNFFGKTPLYEPAPEQDEKQ